MTTTTLLALKEGNERDQWIREQYPRLSTPEWFQESAHPVIPGFIWRYVDGMKVIAGGGVFEGKRWLHVSFSRADRIPDYDDIARVKARFLAGHKAIQVFPRAAEHVNIHAHCLHLWACLDGDSLPDFTRGTGGI